jgi:hypothetical protein
MKDEGYEGGGGGPIQIQICIFNGQTLQNRSKSTGKYLVLFYCVDSIYFSPEKMAVGEQSSVSNFFFGRVSVLQ